MAPLRPPTKLGGEQAYLPSTAIDRRSFVCPTGIRPNLAHLDESIDIERSRELNGQPRAGKRIRRSKRNTGQEGMRARNVRWWLCSFAQSALLRFERITLRSASCSHGTVSSLVVAAWRNILWDVSCRPEVFIFMVRMESRQSRPFWRAGAEKVASKR